jgi:hypothetical protein
MLLGLRTCLKLAAGLGLEPRYSPPKGDVLPLDDPARSPLCVNSVKEGKFESEAWKRARAHQLPCLKHSKERVGVDTSLFREFLKECVVLLRHSTLSFLEFAGDVSRKEHRPKILEKKSV